MRTAGHHARRRNPTCAPEVVDALEQSQELWDVLAERLRGDPVARRALEQLANAASALEAAMRAARMDRLCRACGEQTGGGCCGASVARQAQPILLLVNRLLGASPSPQHDDFTMCCYLGERGCVLIVKPPLCVHYDCPEMLASVDPARLEQVRVAREALVGAWVRVEELVLETLEASQHV